MDARQLGLLEVATDIEAIAVDQREQGIAGHSVIALAGQQVSHVTRDLGVHMGTLQVQFGLLQCRLCQLHPGLGQPQVGLLAQQLRFGDVNVSVGFFPFFVGDGRILLQANAPVLFAAALAQLGLHRDDGGIRLAKAGTGHFHGTARAQYGQFKALGVDLQQQVALFHMLVVVDQQLDDPAGDFGRLGHAVDADARIPRPRRAGVMLPGHPAQPQRQQHHGKGQGGSQHFLPVAHLNSRPPLPISVWRTTRHTTRLRTGPGARPGA
ncbi:hypothetical protein D3C85_950690 [compost metagenome]